MDAVLRLRSLHRLRPRTRCGFTDSARRRQPRHESRLVESRRCRGSISWSQAATRFVGILYAASNLHWGDVVKGGSAFPVRLKFSKFGKVRWTSHRDIARMFERAFRILELPLEFSEGFSPHPKVSFGLALSTGYESNEEYLDVSLTQPIDLETLPERLTTALPLGITVVRAIALDARVPALQETVTAVEWIVEVARDDDVAIGLDEFASAVDAALAREEITIERSRKGKLVDDDVRGAIRHCRVSLDEATAMIVCDLEVSTQPRSAKPFDVLAAIMQVTPAIGPLVERRVLRVHQWIERDGARLCPLDADARPHAASARAS